MLITEIQIFILLVKTVTYAHEFDDQVQYQISWKGPLQHKLAPSKYDVVVLTNENEQYQCIVPEINDEDQDDTYIEGYKSPESLLLNFFQSTSPMCSLRLEPYWTYKLCHGSSIIQYHEEGFTDDGITKIHRMSEYNLGVLSPEKRNEFIHKANTVVLDKQKTKVPKQKINDQETPYFPIEMTHGDPCDLTGEPRRTTVFYICHPTADNELMSIKEVTTCHYEVVVLSSLLCLNPNYKVKTKTTHEINCHSLGDAPSKPTRLTSMHNEYAQQFPSAVPVVSEVPSHRAKVKPNIDPDINRRFLNGEYCLIGGSGWWQYEFCNGKFVNQFHVEANKRSVTIRLGSWNKEEHIKWFNLKKGKSVDKRHVIHLYSGGDICDLTGEPRLAFVYLVCRPGSGQELIISMSEDKTCQYKVTVESPILCQFIKNVDEFGLFNNGAWHRRKFINFLYPFIKKSFIKQLFTRKFWQQSINNKRFGEVKKIVINMTLKYIFWLPFLSFVISTKTTKLTNIYKLSTQNSLNKKARAPIDSNVDDIKESTDFAEREKKWKQIIMEGEMLPEHNSMLKQNKMDFRKGEIPHLEQTLVPKPEMMASEDSKRTKIETPLSYVALKSGNNEDSLTTAEETSEESASGSGSDLKTVTEAENDVIKSEGEYEPEKENTKVGKRRGSMKCERKCSVPLEYHECAHPRCDFKIGTIKDLCFFLCKHQKERCEDVCI